MRLALRNLAMAAGSRLGIAWLGALVLLGIAGQAAYEIVDSHRLAVQATERELDAQSRVIAEQTARGLQAIDVVLRGLVRQLQSGPLASASRDELHQVLKEQAQGLVQADGLVVMFPDGTVRAASHAPAAQLPPVDVSQEPDFMVLRDDAGAGLHIGKTVLGPAQRWIFPIGRRLTGHGGAFAGTVGAPGRVAYFQQFYGDAYPDPSTRIALVRRDGPLLARHPPADGLLGRPVAGLASMLPADASGPATVLRSASPLDGRDRFVALRLVPDYPLAVAVSRDAAAALAPWYSQAVATAWRTLALGLLAGGLLVVVLRQLQRLQVARASLEASQERYTQAITGSNEGHWVWEIPTDGVYASPRLKEIFGLPPDVQLASFTHYFSLIPIHPDDRDRVRKAREDHVAGKTPQLDHEFRIVLPGSAEVRWVHTRGRCFRDAQGRPLRLAGATVDATRRKRAEIALRESEERYALAMTGSRGGHWVWDAVSDGLFVSGTVNELFGLPADTQPGTRSDYFARVRVHPDDGARIAQLGDDLLSGRARRADYEFRIVLPDGSLRWILSRAQRFDGADGQGLRIAGVSVDISERKQADAERERLELQLRNAQKLEAIGTLAGGIAHDFNNILSAILGYGELAQRDAAEGTPLRRHIDAAMSAGHRAKSLVERILAFSRSGMGERVPVHVQAVLDEVLDGVATSLPPGIRLVRSVSTGDAGVLGDPTQLHQVVLNLCANAVHAMKQDGELVVAAGVATLDAPLPLATSTLAPGLHVCLEVRDSGSGMAPELLERIFDPFFTTKDIGVGTGLGLSLVHGIVTDLGGGIAVQSRPGQGSTFTVWLPCRRWVAVPAAAEAPVIQGQGETVLLVDDEESLVRLGEEMLAELGYEPVGYASSQAALGAFRAAPDRFDAVLSDEAMPGLTGSDLAQEIRRLRRDLPIVLMSGYVSPGLAQRAQELGVDVIAKPLSSRDIARSLAAALRREAPAAAVPAAAS